MRADNGVDRAGTSTMRAADAQGLVNNGNCGSNGFRERYDVPSEQVGKPPNRLFAARRAEIDCGPAFNNGSSVWPTAGIAALSALRLWEKVIDLFNEIAGA